MTFHVILWYKRAAALLPLYYKERKVTTHCHSIEFYVICICLICLNTVSGYCSSIQYSQHWQLCLRFPPTCPSYTCVCDICLICWKRKTVFFDLYQGFWGAVTLSPCFNLYLYMWWLVSPTFAVQVYFSIIIILHNIQHLHCIWIFMNYVDCVIMCIYVWLNTSSFTNTYMRCHLRQTSHDSV